MIIATCPLRIAFAGGSTDLQDFVDHNGHGSVINCAINLKTYLTLHQDVIGFSSHLNKYIINYSVREETDNVDSIQNDLVRECFKYFNVDPCTCSLTSDIFSSGSGLASSSSYLVGLTKAVCHQQNISITNFDICQKSMLIERRFNPLVGYQDPFGCGVGGINRLRITKPNTVECEPISTNIFNELDMYLIHTRLNRTSTQLLKNIDKNQTIHLLPLVDAMQDAMLNSDITSFSKIIKEGWSRKKNSNPTVTSKLEVSSIDESLASNPDILSHRLCGAGNGGFFLVFANSGYDISQLNFSKITPISVSSEGVECCEV